MTTRELLYIKTIADEGSMTRAAQKLFVPMTFRLCIC